MKLHGVILTMGGRHGQSREGFSLRALNAPSGGAALEEEKEIS